MIRIRRGSGPLPDQAASTDVIAISFPEQAFAEPADVRVHTSTDPTLLAGIDRFLETVPRRFIRTPLVDKQIPEQAKEFGISEEEVIQKIMLKDTVDGEFTTLDDVANVALTLAAFETNALTGQSIVVSHGWFMQ